MQDALIFESQDIQYEVESMYEIFKDQLGFVDLDVIMV